jgi:hypothetical protein
MELRRQHAIAERYADERALGRKMEVIVLLGGGTRRR